MEKMHPADCCIGFDLQPKACGCHDKLFSGKVGPMMQMMQNHFFLVYQPIYGVMLWKKKMKMKCFKRK